ncbi:6-phosphogluconate dehydrogenase C-terminal domain-like protein [Lepidopterella palustris CBS 459.81]|uniref:6-phosphogluconate dehydrogenase C-terminal domain-like protein n=1 Tax=Lepidopterella palustris CBS 459.81 TaxID=1314670 RepID=A0A8E2E1P6_9PEZI|nr:6-phosphogluconate dehydrogenase C-terminal domain-like protein [Lepidopterella palustris CBS 459.81]
MSAPLATVGILSIGSMGVGVAKLLQANNYRVLTNVTNRSPSTQSRASSASIHLVSTDTELVAQCDYVLSIVPPRDAVSTAKRIINALNQTPSPRPSALPPLYFLDLNAISPSTARKIDSDFQSVASNLRFIDGGIIGGPPCPSSDSSSWKRPGIPISGPHPLHEAPTNGAHLAETLNTQYLSATIGSASGLKCCFASMNKGFTALALQSFSTASSLNVLPELQQYLSEYTPMVGELAARGVVGCPPKAYRWVEEMVQIGQCFEEDGGWGEQARIFGKVSEVFELLGKGVEEGYGTQVMGDVEKVVSVLRKELDGPSAKVKVPKEQEQEQEQEQEDR